MKRIGLIRHAKSSWKDSSCQDIDRPLNRRGKSNAALMGRRLCEQEPNWSRIYCSPAKRARQTAYLISQMVGLTEGNIEIIPSLYAFNYEELLSWIRSLERNEDRLLIVGHNPAITDLVNFLALSDLEKIPTCGVALLKLNTVNWRQAGVGMGKITYYDYPKNHDLNSG